MYPLSSQTDLFRRFMCGLPISWHLLEESLPTLKSRIPEFRGFVEQFGMAQVAFSPKRQYRGEATIIAGDDRQFFGFEIGQRVFFLPCHAPTSRNEAFQMATSAIEAVLAYLRRISQEIPTWASEFVFSREADLRKRVQQHRDEAVRLEAELDSYAKRKGALCYRSEPLVGVVIPILESVFRLRIESEEQCIEDVRVLDDDGNIIAVVEIKGVNGSFTRQHINQVDSHRERLELTPETPGLLIMNTKMTAESLADKDETPHPDIIQKAGCGALSCANVSQ